MDEWILLQLPQYSGERGMQVSAQISDIIWGVRAGIPPAHLLLFESSVGLP